MTWNRPMLVPVLLWLWAATGLGGAAGPPAAAPGTPSAYTVVLDAPSVGKRLSASRPKRPDRAPRRADAASVELLARAVAKTQVPLKDSIAASGATVLGSVTNVLNAVFVRATPEQAEAIAALEGVRRVVPGRKLALEISGVAEVVKLPEARLWPAGVAATGEGIRIAIIDSGLDFDHEAFQDDSLRALPGYPRGRPEHLRFANRKIIAVRSYLRLRNSGLPETSTPDDETPRDSSGHGTAVAMIAAGRRVDSPAGPLEGVAPRAYLGVYKVSGSPSINPEPTSAAVIAAIDDAIADEMDILNLSLSGPATFPWHAYGSDCGLAGDFSDCDPLAVAAQSAVVDFGRVVVAAAGNYGAHGWGGFPARNSIGSPAVAPDVIAVGASENRHRLAHRVRIGSRSFPALSGTGVGLGTSLTAPLVQAADLANPFACEPFPADSLAESVVAVERGECDFRDKIEHAGAAGALAALVRNGAGRDELVEMTGLDETDIPAFSIGAADGRALAGLAEAAADGRPAVVTLEAAPWEERRDWTRVADFSSRGPTPGLNLKPDIAAPGSFVYSATRRSAPRSDAFRPSGYRQAHGTSLAAPVVAGAAALVWQRHPGLEASEVASALINTASQALVEDGGRARAMAVGGGLLDISRALDPIATVEPPTVGFGIFGAQDLPVWQEILVTNRGARDEAYRMVAEPRDLDPRAAVTIGGASEVSFRLRAGEWIRLRIALEGNLPAAGSYEGQLRLVRIGDGRDLLVPYAYVVGDGDPRNVFVLAGEESAGVAGERTERDLVAKFVDGHGAPATAAPVRFRVREGDANIVAADTRTDAFGLAFARVAYSGRPGLQVVAAQAGALEARFHFEASALRPEILEVANAAHLHRGHPVAPGSIIAILGAGLAEFEGAAPEGTLPFSLKSASVSFDFPELGLSVAGRPLFASAGQLNAQVPWELAGVNFAFVKVRVRSAQGDSFVSEPYVLDLADIAPGIFSFDLADGRQLPAVHHSDGFLVTPEDPARPGGEVSVFMTGNGPLAEPVRTGEAADRPNRTRHEPVVSIAGVPAAVAYSGAVPRFAGMYQIDAFVPRNVPAGDLELLVTVDGVPSNPVILPVR